MLLTATIDLALGSSSKILWAFLLWTLITLNTWTNHTHLKMTKTWFCNPLLKISQAIIIVWTLRTVVNKFVGVAVQTTDYCLLVEQKLIRKERGKPPPLVTADVHTRLLLLISDVRSTRSPLDAFACQSIIVVSVILKISFRSHKLMLLTTLLSQMRGI